MKKGLILRSVLSLPAAAGIVWFCIPFFWSVHNIGNFSGLALCVLVLLACVFYPKIREKCEKSAKLKLAWRLVCILFCAGIVWAGVLTGLMAAGIGNLPPEHATVVVLGSKVTGRYPSADLMVRIQTAAAYLKAHPAANCVASGGQGAGELVTEASVIREYLVQMGIDASRIVTEETSTNTQQNFANSLKIIDGKKWSRDLAVVTDDYHQYRAGRIARRQGGTPYAVAAPTPWYIFSACYMRELLALTKFFLLP